MGINKWITFHYIDTSTSDITNAINSQNNAINNTTSAVENNTQAVNDMTDAMTDSSTNSNSENENKINSFNSNIASNGTIQSLFTMPIKLFQNVLNGIGGTCQPFNLGNLFGEPFTMDCINVENIVGSTLWHVIDVLICTFFIWTMSKRFISIFEKFTSMKDGKDEVGD